MRTDCIFLLFLLSLDRCNTSVSVLWVVCIYVYICLDCMCIYLAVVLSHNTLFCTYLLTHQFCGPFGLFALGSICRLPCSILHSRRLTPALWQFDTSGRWEDRSKGRQSLYPSPSLSCKALLAVAIHPQPPWLSYPCGSSFCWVTLHLGSQQLHLHPLSFQAVGGSSFLLSLS